MEKNRKLGIKKISIDKAKALTASVGGACTTICYGSDIGPQVCRTICDKPAY